MKWYYVYVLLSGKDGMFYLGMTSRLRERLSEHTQGKNISTTKRRPLTLVYFEGHRDKSDAERRESYFKTAKGKTTLRQIIRDFLQNSK